MAIDAQLQQLLETPTERLEVELKGWLDLSTPEHRAKVAKGILALANHGGGSVIFGFESNGTLSPNRPADLSGYSQDIINDILDGFADPAFHCNVHNVRRIADGLIYPIAVVPGGHKTPVRSKRDGPPKGGGAPEISKDRYYIRRPGPASEPPQAAHEWNELLERCMANRRDEIVDVIRSVLEGRAPKPEAPPAAQDQLAKWKNDALQHWGHVLTSKPRDAPQRMPLGFYTFSCKIEGVDASAKQLEAAIQEAGRTKHTGWSPWWWPTREGLRPYIKDDAIEGNMGSLDNADAGHSDFWRISKTGEMFMIRGYVEDGGDIGRPDIKPGTALDITLPVWRIGEMLLFVERFAKALGVPDAQVHVQCSWTGLENRRLVSVSGRRMVWDDRVSRANEVETRAVVPASQISARLPDLVRELTEPLYQLFDFFTPPSSLYTEELAQMKSGRF